MRLERMDLQSKVETTEEGGPLVLEQLHVPYRGAAKQDPQPGAACGAIEQRAKYSSEFGTATE